MAEALRARGLEATLVELLPHVLRLVDEEIAEDVEAELVKAGVNLRRSCPVGRIEGYGRVGRLVAGGEAIDATMAGAPIKVKLVAERGTGRLLGAQLAGTEGVAKRVDVVAAALHAGATVDELGSFDLSYAPPFALVWDPLLIAARQAQRQV
jgi:NADPH-dependent 2,4-dienoyl-CoA reductase/sulfur reductase-like enzyme